MISHPSVLSALEDESIEIFRETAAAFRKPVMLYSIGKDSSVLLHLARKAFAPGHIPFPLVCFVCSSFFPRASRGTRTCVPFFARWVQSPFINTVPKLRAFWCAQKFAVLLFACCLLVLRFDFENAFTLRARVCSILLNLSLNFAQIEPSQGC